MDRLKDRYLISLYIAGRVLVGVQILYCEELRK